MPNGAQALIKTLANAGIDVCFSNPGTSEMHFVAALDDEPRMRAVLALFEGVATGAADGYARMADKPAATLLHLGPGLGNGLANLHNARKGKTPVINIVGDHATWHTQYDAQLQSDIETMARNVSPDFVRTSTTTAELSQDAVDAIAAAQGPPGQVATLILPADVSWGEGGQVLTPPAPPRPPAAGDDAISAIADILAGDEQVAFLLGGRALREPALMAVSKIAEKTGARVFAECFPTRMQRGAGLPPVDRIAYLAELVAVQLHEVKHLVLVDARSPVSFFAYPGRASDLVPEGCQVHTLSTDSEDAAASLEKLVAAAGAQDTPARIQPPRRPGRPRGRPAPRCMRVGKHSANTRAPVFSAIFETAISAGSRSARPPSKKATCSSPARISAMALMASSPAAGGRGGAGGVSTWPPSPHDTSAGRISVATWPGGPWAAAMASTASCESSAVVVEVRTKSGETLRAMVSMSDCNWASYWVCQVAWSPTMLITGVLPLRALCRLARPLPSPGPRCSSVAAGLSAMRA